MSLHIAQIKSNKAARIVWFIFGCISAMFGLVGIIIPGLPTTVFMLIAAACFYRSSQTFYDWVINHKLFGYHVKNFREGYGMSIKAKIMATLIMWIFILFAVGFGIPNYLLWAKTLTVLAALAGTTYIYSLPTMKD